MPIPSIPGYYRTTHELLHLLVQAADAHPEPFRLYAKGGANNPFGVVEQRGLPQGSLTVHLHDLQQLARTGYLSQSAIQFGATFELTARAFPSAAARGWADG